MKTSRYLFLIILVFGSLVYLQFSEDTRTNYEQFVNSHPYNNTTYQSVSNRPKRDRPDLAMEQNFMMTMNPVEKRPTPEKLLGIRGKIKQTGESLLNTPGDQSFPWTERGPSNVGGRTRAILWDPNDANGKKVWAGGVTGGLWFTNDIYDSAAIWSKVNDFWDNLAITSITADPTNTKTIYVGTGESLGGPSTRGLGIWKSTDGGVTWALLASTSEFFYVDDIIARNESGTGVLYVGTKSNHFQGKFHGSNGLYRSIDGGTTFQQVAPKTTNSNYAVADLELGSNNRIWAATRRNSFGEGGGTILFSDDGVNWTKAKEEASLDRVEIAVAPSNDSVVYAIMESGWVVQKVLITRDGGTTWKELTQPNDADDGIDATDFTRGQAGYDLIVAVDPNNDSSVFIGGIDLFKSTNAGTNWTQISHWYGGFGFPNVHADQHALVFKPGSSSDLINGNDGGIYITSNANLNAPTFINRNNNYNVTQFYSCAIHPTPAKDYFLAGSQDNGTQLFTGPGLRVTKEAYGGDGAYCFIDQDNPNYQIVSYIHNSYYLSKDGGINFNDPNNAIASDESTGRFINPADYDDKKNILYSASTDKSIGRFLDITGSPTRSDITINLGSTATNLKVSPFDSLSTTLFVGTEAGKIFKISNADGSSPTSKDISTGIPNGWISSIELGGSLDTILVTLSNYGVASVWLSVDGGNQWINKEGDLPDLPVRWGLINPLNYKEVILATELGIWSTKDISIASPKWTQTINGMANVRVDMLQIRQSDNEIIAATHGRGLFSSNAWNKNFANVQAPNLTSYKHVAWSSFIVSRNIASSAQSDISTPISHEDSIFLGFAAKNSGNISITDTTLYEIQVDNNIVKEGFISTDTIAVDSVLLFLNVKLAPLSVGNHEVKIILDSKKNLNESNESDNTISKTIYIQASCNGDTSVTPTTGTISDGSGPDDYLGNRDCSWNLEPENADSIFIEFKSFNTEVNSDVLKLSTNDEEFSYSGTDLPARLAFESSFVTIAFTTDESAGSSGWEIEFSSIDVPDPIAPTNLKVDSLSFRSASLTWDDNSDNEDAFIIERSIDGQSFDQIAEVDTTGYIDKTVIMNTTYDYRVLAKNRFDLSEPSNIVSVTTPLGLEKPALSIYPNPFTSIITVELSDNQYSEYNIIDLSGKHVLSGTLSQSLSNIDLGEIKTGIYYLILKNNHNSITQKLLKQ